VPVVHCQIDDGINLGFSKAPFMRNDSAFPVKSLRSLEILQFTMDNVPRIIFSKPLEFLVGFFA
jgi:hypothetical protein